MEQLNKFGDRWFLSLGPNKFEDRDNLDEFENLNSRFVCLVTEMIQLNKFRNRRWTLLEEKGCGLFARTVGFPQPVTGFLSRSGGGRCRRGVMMPCSFVVTGLLFWRTHSYEIETEVAALQGWGLSKDSMFALSFHFVIALYNLPSNSCSNTSSIQLQLPNWSKVVRKSTCSDKIPTTTQHFFMSSKQDTHFFWNKKIG